MAGITKKSFDAPDERFSPDPDRRSVEPNHAQCGNPVPALEQRVPQRAFEKLIDRLIHAQRPEHRIAERAVPQSATPAAQ